MSYTDQLVVENGVINSELSFGMNRGSARPYALDNYLQQGSLSATNSSHVRNMALDRGRHRHRIKTRCSMGPRASSPRQSGPQDGRATPAVVQQGSHATPQSRPVGFNATPQSRPVGFNAAPQSCPVSKLRSEVAPRRPLEFHDDNKLTTAAHCLFDVLFVTPETDSCIT